MRIVRSATAVFDFTAVELTQQDLRFSARGHVESEESSGVGGRFTFPLQTEGSLRLVAGANGSVHVLDGALELCGALLLDAPGSRVVIGNLMILPLGDGALEIETTLDEASGPYPTFHIPASLLQANSVDARLSVTGELFLDSGWAESAGLEQLAGVPVGRLTIESDPLPPTSDEAVPSGSCGSAAADGAVASSGPDVIIGDLQSVVRFDRIGDITAYAVGTNACNIGTQRVNWISYTNQHPVIIQNMYRLKDDRFEQIGMSWLKHGFYVVSQSLCTPCNDPTDGTQLGVGCSDPYSAYLNGVQTNMSPRSTVNAHTGEFPLWQGSAPADTIERRLEVHDADLKPSLNTGARYFIEGLYITPDEHAWDTNDNNASYREVTVTEPSANFFSVTVSSRVPTQRQQPAVRAWQDVDPAVTETDIHVPGEGLFILAAKSYEVTPGVWRYSYALENLNSDRSGQRFSVPLPAGATVSNVTFHGIAHHSGEIYDTADWSAVVSGSSITWSTTPFGVNENANALRFNTTFGFHFDASVAPMTTTVTIGLFRPGFPPEVTGRSVGPTLDLTDCNGNGVDDACDVDCAAAGCAPPCDTSGDCDTDGVPDECQPDCDGDTIPDVCELADCPPGDLTCADCNHNLTPDGCEADCDLDGIPDDCDPPGDADGDGIDDCADLCPSATIGSKCTCPLLAECCWGLSCIPDYPRLSCLSDGGTPGCIEAPCRQGCLLGDVNDDGDIDHRDVARQQNCFSGPANAPGFTAPAMECVIPLDFDGDEDVDLDDYRQMQREVSGPRG